MKIFRWLAVSLSMYSRIPMPHFEWKEDDMGHSLMFFPLVGVIIGGLTVLLNSLDIICELPLFVKTVITVLIPIIITGGFHLDGYMDTQDALSSFADSEKKLEILKDPHIGAFAVIGLVTQILIMIAGVGMILDSENYSILIIFSLIFVISRSLSGITSIVFTKAKKDGMLSNETNGNMKSVTVALVIWLVLALVLMILTDVLIAAAVIIAFTIFTVYYRYMTLKHFKGVSGDTAGYFVTVSQSLASVILALITLL